MTDFFFFQCEKGRKHGSRGNKMINMWNKPHLLSINSEMNVCICVHVCAG